MVCFSGNFYPSANKPKKRIPSLNAKIPMPFLAQRCRSGQKNPPQEDSCGGYYAVAVQLSIFSLSQKAVLFRLDFCDYNNNTLSWSCQCQVSDTLVSTFQNIYAFTHGQGVSESLYPFKAQTGAGFRVNFRRISEGGYPTAALYVGGKAFSMRCYAK